MWQGHASFFTWAITLLANYRSEEYKIGIRSTKSIWAIPALRHVYLGVDCRIGSSPPRNGPPKELQVLHIDAADNDCFQGGMVAFWGQMTQLTTLWLYAFNMPAPMIHILANMTYLVEADLGIFERLNKLPESQLFPQGLRQLHLGAEAIEEDPMPILEKLPCLVVLILRGYSGSIMVCSAQGFPRLQDLELQFFGCDQWRIEIGAMPSLSCLKLFVWLKMTKLPEGLLYLPSLKELSLANMPQISEDDVTLKNLRGKGCKVSRNFPPPISTLIFYYISSSKQGFVYRCKLLINRHGGMWSIDFFFLDKGSITSGLYTNQQGCIQPLNSTNI